MAPPSSHHTRLLQLRATASQLEQQQQQVEAEIQALVLNDAEECHVQHQGPIALSGNILENRDLQLSSWKEKKTRTKRKSLPGSACFDIGIQKAQYRRKPYTKERRQETRSLHACIRCRLRKLRVGIIDKSAAGKGIYLTYAVLTPGRLRSMSQICCQKPWNQSSRVECLYQGLSPIDEHIRQWVKLPDTMDHIEWLSRTNKSQPKIQSQAQRCRKNFQWKQPYEFLLPRNCG